MLSTDMHLNYPNPLQPDKWPRESSGPKAQVTEMMRYFVKQADLENPKLTAVPYHGTWHRITPWLPWMLMGQTPGHCMYASTMVGFDSIEKLPKHVRGLRDEAQARHAQGADRGLRPEPLEPRALLARSRSRRP